MKPLIIANWKCNPATEKEAKELFEDIKGAIKKTNKAEILISTPFIWLSVVKGAKKCAQNCFWEEKGPYTGEISPKMLKDVGVDYVIIGHSERRNYFNETDEIINKKLKSALNAGLVPVLCIGEKKGENAKEVIDRQLREDLSGIENCKPGIENLIIAYEPVWAISTSGGEICSPERAKEVLRFIKEKFNGKIIYGGSVDSKIINNYLNVGYEGALVGGASLKVDEFVNLIKNVGS
jgi:triosephosphate isomerase